MSEKHSRSIVKTVSYRIFSSSGTAVFIYFLTGNFVITISIGLAEITAKPLLYYLHERAWSKIHWGKNPHTAQHDTRTK